MFKNIFFECDTKKTDYCKRSANLRKEEEMIYFSVVYRLFIHNIKLLFLCYSRKFRDLKFINTYCMIF